MRFAVVLTLIFTIGSGNVWGAAGDVIKEFDCDVSAKTTYARQTPTCDGITWNVSWGQTSYIGTNKSSNYGNLKITNSTDLNAGKAVNASITTSTKGYCAIIPQSTMANVGKITISCSALSGSPAVYVVSSSSLSTAYTQITLKTGSGLAAQGATLTTDGLTFEFDKKASGTYYAIVFYSTSWYRLTSTDLQFIEGAAAASTYTVTYNGNGNSGGTVPTDATAYSSGATVTVKGNTGSLVKTGYAFGGWNTQADGNGTNYTAGSGTFTISANTTLYAKWIPTYTVTYNGNGNSGGTIPTDATAYNSGTTVTVKGNTGSLVKTGWTFAGWNTNATGTGTNYTAGSGTFTISANTTLYAKWTCTVTWSVNGATNVYSATTVTYNSSGSKVASIPSPNPNPASYCGDKFVGWTSDANYVHGTSNLFTTAAGSPNLNSTGSTTFYAVFADYDE